MQGATGISCGDSGCVEIFTLDFGGVFLYILSFFEAVGQSLKEVQGTNIQAERVHGGLNLNLTFRLLHLTSYSPKNPFNGVYYCYKFINWQTL